MVIRGHGTEQQEVAREVEATEDLADNWHDNVVCEAGHYLRERGTDDYRDGEIKQFPLAINALNSESIDGLPVSRPVGVATFRRCFSSFQAAMTRRHYKTSIVDLVKLLGKSRPSGWFCALRSTLGIMTLGITALGRLGWRLLSAFHELTLGVTTLGCGQGWAEPAIKPKADKATINLRIRLSPCVGRASLRPLLGRRELHRCNFDSRFTAQTFGGTSEEALQPSKHRRRPALPFEQRRKLSQRSLATNVLNNLR